MFLESIFSIQFLWSQTKKTSKHSHPSFSCKFQQKFEFQGSSFWSQIKIKKARCIGVIMHVFSEVSISRGCRGLEMFWGRLFVML
jgi:hypothetical protein